MIDDRCQICAPFAAEYPHIPCLLMLGHMGPHSWERRPEPPPCRFCNCVPCLCFPGISALTPILERIALELEIRNRKDELATALREHPIGWTDGEPPPHIAKRHAALHKRLSAELAKAIARRK